MAHVRKAVKHMYPQCKTCPNNIESFGKCTEGHDNWYERCTKNNGCPIIIQLRKSKKYKTHKKRTMSSKDKKES